MKAKEAMEAIENEILQLHTMGKNEDKWEAVKSLAFRIEAIERELRAIRRGVK